MKWSAMFLASCLFSLALQAQEGTAFNAGWNRDSVALEGYVLGDNHGLKSSLGASARYDHAERAAWGSVFLLLGLPITESEKVIVMLGPQAGVLPHGRGEAGVRTELDFRPSDSFRCGLVGEAYLSNADYPKAQAFVFAGWCF